MALRVFRDFSELTLSASVNGSMKQMPKDYEMKRFVKGETKIMVPPLLIGSGVKRAKCFCDDQLRMQSASGYHSLHQLRGRVGRGAEQSYLRADEQVWIVPKIRESGSIRWCKTDDALRSRSGFEIAGTRKDLMGTQQSGNYRLLDCLTWVKTPPILTLARDAVSQVFGKWFQLNLPKNAPILKTDNRQHKKHAVNGVGLVELVKLWSYFDFLTKNNEQSS